MSLSGLKSIYSQMPPQTAIKAMVSSYWISQCIYVAAKLAIADLLKEGERHCEDIAAITGTNKETGKNAFEDFYGMNLFEDYHKKGSKIGDY